MTYHHIQNKIHTSCPGLPDCIIHSPVPQVTYTLTPLCGGLRLFLDPWPLILRIGSLKFTVPPNVNFLPNFL